MFTQWDFLSFTHICGHTRKGQFTILRKTIAKRLRGKLQQVKKELRRRMHDPVPELGKWLRSVVQGYYNYHGVPYNLPQLYAFRYHLSRAWLMLLRRRSQKARKDRDRENLRKNTQGNTGITNFRISRSSLHKGQVLLKNLSGEPMQEVLDSVYQVRMAMPEAAVDRLSDYATDLIALY